MVFLIFLFLLTNISWSFLGTSKCEIQMAPLSPYIQQRVLQAKSSIWDFNVIEQEILHTFGQPTGT